MPENEHRLPDDMHLGDDELEELFAAAEKCAEAGRVVERIRELGLDNEDAPNLRTGTPATANRDGADHQVCQSPGLVVPNDEKLPMDERQGQSQ